MDSERMDVDSASKDIEHIARDTAGSPSLGAGAPAPPIPEGLDPMTKDDRPLEQRSRRPSPMDPNIYGTPDRPLNVTDALSYLDAVKQRFQDQPDVYNHFLDIMKEFKNEQIDTPGVIQRVSHLFTGHPALIQGFNTFLPAGYRIECSTDPLEAGFITVTTPTGTTVQSMHGGRGLQWSADPPPPYSYGRQMTPAFGADNQGMEPAVQYVQKIKQRCDSDTYRQFLDILSRYHHTPESIDEEEVSRQIAHLFKDAPDLRADFRVFMPDRSQQFVEEPPVHSSSRKDKDRERRKLDVVANQMNSALPQKRKRKATDKEKEREKDISSHKNLPPSKKHKHSSHDTPISYNPKHVVAAPSSPRHKNHHPIPPQRVITNDDVHFFDRVKVFLTDRDIYNEFLKMVNLFAQDFIDTPRLVKESRNFLGQTDLYTQFMNILGWDERKEREHWRNEIASSSGWTKPVIAGLSTRPGRVDLAEKYGSYRKVSASESNVPCSGRDEMCRSVLNDEWVSHPTWTSEDSGFIYNRKNTYEEALHRSEEERHEYDFHIEAITRTIQALEPLNNKISQMSQEDRGGYKLKPNLGGSWKPIHQRVIKKIYGKELGLEVIQCMQDSPSLSIPIVVQRLKQKEEEWKRAQREWNKVWREVDARNYAKSLDHQAISFKTADKKALTTKALVNQVETAREAQMAQRASLIDPLFARTRPRYQLEFVIEDESVLHDAVKLTLSYLDRTQGQLNVTDRKRIETFLRTFIPLFFCINSVDFNSAFVVHDVVESDNSDVDVGSVQEPDDAPGPSSKGGRNGRKHAHTASSGGDLRKKLLKSEQAKSTGRKTRAQEAASAPGSRFASPAPTTADDEREKAEPGFPAIRSSSIPNVFFSNTTFYALLRLIEVLYSRLNHFKICSAKLAKPNEPSSASENGAPVNGSDTSASSASTHFYEMLLGMCERLFENEIEVHPFEDQIRSVFGIKSAFKIFTVDKVIASIIKQVQAVIADPKSQELLEGLKRERSLQVPTTQDIANGRRQAEKVLGPDENVFRIEWLADSKTMTVQLLGKDDPAYEDSEVLTGRWQSYVDSYVSGESTDGVSLNRLRRPYLRRSLPDAIRESPPDVSSQDGLEIKVCVRTYRLFYVSRTEDFIWKYRSKEESEKNARNLQVTNLRRRQWVEKSIASAEPTLS